MYTPAARQPNGVRAFGLVSAVAMTAGAGLIMAGALRAERQTGLPVRTQLVMIETIAPDDLPDPPMLSIEEDTPEPLTPSPIAAPPIVFVPETPPVMTAPVADPAALSETTPALPVASRSTAPRLIAARTPDYPSAARRAGEQGRSELEVCISTGGRVTSVTIARSSGYPRLDDAAMAWIRSERFQPGRVNGIARAVCGHSVYYEWRLREP